MRWEAVSRVDAIITSMEDGFASGEVDFHPNTVSYTAVSCF